MEKSEKMEKITRFSPISPVSPVLHCFIKTNYLDVLIMVPYSKRRRTLNPDEIEPVRNAALGRLLQLAEIRDPKTLDEAQVLYRFAYRTQRCIRGKPVYPSHGTWSELATQLGVKEA